MCTQLYRSLNRLSIIQANDARLLVGRKKAPGSWLFVLEQSEQGYSHGRQARLCPPAPGN